MKYERETCNYCGVWVSIILTRDSAIPPTAWTGHPWSWTAHLHLKRIICRYRQPIPNIYWVCWKGYPDHSENDMGTWRQNAFIWSFWLWDRTETTKRCFYWCSSSLCSRTLLRLTMKGALAAPLGSIIWLTWLFLHLFLAFSQITSGCLCPIFSIPPVL